MNIKPSIVIKKILIRLFSLFVLITILTIHGCEKNPNDLGLNFIPPIDTNSFRYLDSKADTILITNNNYKYFINTSQSQNILIGNYQNYQSKALLRFKNIDPNFDSSNVISAILTLKYSNYYFKDKMGNTSFNIFRVITNFNYSNITFDSVTSSNIGTTSLGSFSGVVADSSSINVTLNNQTVKDWLEYAADTNYANKNYGVALLPNLSSTTIKGFYSSFNSLDLVPYVTVILTKKGAADTITLNQSDYVSLSDAPSSIIPSDRFILQNGIAYRNILNFDLRKLPNNVIINNASLQFTIDNASSFISPFTDKSIVIGMVIDSAGKKDSIFKLAFLNTDSLTYSVNLNGVFQRWNSNILPNLGISMKNYFELQNLDNFVFYSPSVSDTTKMPRLKITYTLRN